MPKKVDTPAPAEAEAPTPAEPSAEGGFDPTAAWDTAVNELGDSSLGGDGSVMQRMPDEKPAPVEENPTEEAEVSAPTEESQEEPEESAPEVSPEMQKMMDKIQGLEEKNAALLAKPAEVVAPEPKPAKEPEPEVELSQEVKDLLEYTPGLDKLIDSRAKAITREIIDEFKNESEQATTTATKEQESTAKETEYWETLGTWFTNEYPELELQTVRNSPDFNDWLASRQNWVDGQMKDTGRYGQSGAQAVFQRYVNEVLPDSSKATKTEQTVKTTRKLAAQRSPSSVNRKAPKSGEADPWNDTVATLQSTAAAPGRQYV